MPVGAEPMQPDHRGVGTRGGLHVDGFGASPLMYQEVHHRRMPITLDQLRRYAVARSLFKPTTLKRAIDKLGFVQADPIRAPARAQDLTLRHRVAGYRAGDLERRYPRLGLEEDFFVNYGYLPHAHHALMHPRTPRKPWTKNQGRAGRRRCWNSPRERGVVHPREVDAHFAHGRVTNWFGGTSNGQHAAARPGCSIAACCASRGAKEAPACMRRVRRGSPTP